MTKANTNTEQPQPRQPTHRLFCVTGNGKASTWTRVGAAWPNKDGNGFSFQLEAVPVQGSRLIMRKIEAAQAGGPK